MLFPRVSRMGMLASRVRPTFPFTEKFEPRKLSLAPMATLVGVICNVGQPTICPRAGCTNEATMPNNPPPATPTNIRTITQKKRVGGILNEGKCSGGLRLSTTGGLRFSTIGTGRGVTGVRGIPGVPGVPVVLNVLDVLDVPGVTGMTGLTGVTGGGETRGNSEETIFCQVRPFLPPFPPPFQPSLPLKWPRSISVSSQTMSYCARGVLGGELADRERSSIGLTGAGGGRSGLETPLSSVTRA